MSELFEKKLHHFTAQVEKLHLQIDHVNEATDCAIVELEEKKKELRKCIDPNSDLIEEHVRNITLGHDKTIEKLIKTKKVEVELKKTSTDQIDYVIDQLDKEISRIQADRNSVVLSLKSKTYKIETCQRCIENLSHLTDAISRQIKDCKSNYKIQMHSLWRQKESLLARRDLRPTEINLCLAELDWKIVNKQQCHQDYIKSLQRQREETFFKLKELNMETRSSDNLNCEPQDLHKDEKMVDVTSEIEEYSTTAPYRRQQTDEINLLRELISIGLQLTPSGHVVTGSGRVLNLEEAIAAGLLDGMDYSRLLDSEPKSVASERTLSYDGDMDTNSSVAL